VIDAFRGTTEDDLVRPGTTDARPTTTRDDRRRRTTDDDG
jgi:hypothetical protein